MGVYTLAMSAKMQKSGQSHRKNIDGAQRTLPAGCVVSVGDRIMVSHGSTRVAGGVRVGNSYVFDPPPTVPLGRSMFDVVSSDGARDTFRWH